MSQRHAHPGDSNAARGASSQHTSTWSRSGGHGQATALGHAHRFSDQTSDGDASGGRSWVPGPRPGHPQGILRGRDPHFRSEDDEAETRDSEGTEPRAEVRRDATARAPDRAFEVGVAFLVQDQTGFPVWCQMWKEKKKPNENNQKDQNK